MKPTHVARRFRRPHVALPRFTVAEDFLISFSFDQRASQNNTKLTLRCVKQLNAFRSRSRPNQMMSVGSDKTCAEGQKERLGRGL